MITNLQIHIPSLLQTETKDLPTIVPLEDVMEKAPTAGERYEG